jgi:serine/threonine protein kinase
VDEKLPEKSLKRMNGGRKTSRKSLKRKTKLRGGDLSTEEGCKQAGYEWVWDACACNEGEIGPPPNCITETPEKKRHPVNAPVITMKTPETMTMNNCKTTYNLHTKKELDEKVKDAIFKTANKSKTGRTAWEKFGWALLKIGAPIVGHKLDNWRRGVLKKRKETEAYKFYNIAKELATTNKDTWKENTGEDIEATIREPREIKRSHVTLVTKIGNGAFGDVWKAFLDESKAGGVPGYEVAVKTCIADGADGGDSEKDLLIEATIMASVPYHDNILSLIGVVTRGTPLYLILPICQGSLLSFLKKPPPQMPNQRVITAEDKIKFAIDIAKGMEHLTKNNCVHRDLAARNVLIDTLEKCKVADFGLSRSTTASAAPMLRSTAPNAAPTAAPNAAPTAAPTVDPTAAPTAAPTAGDPEYSTTTEDSIGEEDVYYRSGEGQFPVRWTAPEAMETFKFTTYTDVWSYGITLLEIFNDGATPYEDKTNLKVMEMIQNEETAKQPRSCHDDFWNNILKPCFKFEPKDRPTFTKLVAQIEEYYDQENYEGEYPNTEAQMKQRDMNLENVEEITNENTGKSVQVKTLAEGYVAGTNPYAANPSTNTEQTGSATQSTTDPTYVPQGGAKDQAAARKSSVMYAIQSAPDPTYVPQGSAKDQADARKSSVMYAPSGSPAATPVVKDHATSQEKGEYISVVEGQSAIESGNRKDRTFGPQASPAKTFKIVKQTDL